MFKVKQEDISNVLKKLQAPPVLIPFDSGDVFEGRDQLQKVGPCGFCKGILIKPMECPSGKCNWYYCSQCLKKNFQGTCVNCEIKVSTFQPMNRNVKKLTLDKVNFKHCCSLEKDNLENESKEDQKKQEKQVYSYDQYVQHFQFDCKARRNLECPNCHLCNIFSRRGFDSQKFTKSELIKHLQEECQTQTVECSECQSRKSRNFSKQHDTQECIQYIKQRVGTQEKTIQDLKQEVEKLTRNDDEFERSSFEFEFELEYVDPADPTNNDRSSRIQGPLFRQRRIRRPVFGYGHRHRAPAPHRPTSITRDLTAHERRRIILQRRRNMNENGL